VSYPNVTKAMMDAWLNATMSVQHIEKEDRRSYTLANGDEIPVYHVAYFDETEFKAKSMMYYVDDEGRSTESAVLVNTGNPHSMYEWLVTNGHLDAGDVPDAPEPEVRWRDEVEGFLDDLVDAETISAYQIVSHNEEAERSRVRVIISGQEQYHIVSPDGSGGYSYPEYTPATTQEPSP